MKARLSLVPSAHPSAWTVSAEQQGKTGHSSLLCRFCSQPTVGWQEAYHLNDDHEDGSEGNVVPVCPLCHLPQHLNRPEIDREAILIWLPEMAQPALNLLIRQIDLSAQAASKPRGRSALPGHHFAREALAERAEVAEIRLGTRSPRQLGLALLNLSPDEYARRAERLGGVRLLPLGQLFRSGADIYPQMLADWAASANPVTPHL